MGRGKSSCFKSMDTMDMSFRFGRNGPLYVIFDSSECARIRKLSSLIEFNRRSFEWHEPLITENSVSRINLQRYSRCIRNNIFS